LSVESRNHTHDGANHPIARIAAPYPCNPAFSLRSATLIPIETRNQLQERSDEMLAQTSAERVKKVQIRSDIPRVAHRHVLGAAAVTVL